MVFQISAGVKARMQMRKSEWKWRIEIMLVTLALGILVGAIAAGQLKFLFRW
jgi:hypothetical protein